MDITANSLIVNKLSGNHGYKRSFLRQVVMEFRFPTLLEIGKSNPPAKLINALRKEYPHLDSSSEVKLGIGATADATTVHNFKSSKMSWFVNFKTSSFAIETNKYTTFEEFKDRMMRVVDAATPVIDTDFFTRIGLRYINSIEVDDDPSDGWINPELVAPLRSGNFRGIHDFDGRLHLLAEDGACLLQHGIRLRDDASPSYSIDIDASRTDVRLDEVSRIADDLHSQAFNMFEWAAGEKLKNHLLTTK